MAIRFFERKDCHVASLLAMTERRMIQLQTCHNPQPRFAQQPPERGHEGVVRFDHPEGIPQFRIQHSLRQTAIGLVSQIIRANFREFAQGIGKKVLTSRLCIV